MHLWHSWPLAIDNSSAFIELDRVVYTHSHDDVVEGFSLVVGPEVITTVTAVEVTKMYILFTPPVYKLDYVVK